MALEDYTDLTYRERTLLAEYRLSDEKDKEKILQELKALNAQKTTVKSEEENVDNP